MFIDFSEYPANKTIESDVCIIGAGAAGISLAHAFSNTSLKVCLLETGRFTPETAHNQLTRTTEGRGDYQTYGCRQRFFGGSTNHWGGQSMPLEDIDFAKRSWVPYSGWPISRADLEPWYAEANSMLGAGIYAYTKDALSSDDWPFPNIDFNLLEEVYWRVSPNATAFSGNFRDDLENSENVTVFLNATATALHADPSGKTVKSATIKEPDGKTATVRARYFIVAAGALESARLLLASQDVMPDGLGNDHDIVGRFFMMHPHVDLGKAVGLDDQMSSYFTDYMQGGAELIPGFRPSVDSQRDNRILNGAITLEPVVDNISGYYSIKRISKDLTRSYRSLRYGVGSPELSDEFGDWVLRALTDIDSTVGGLWKNATDATYEGEYASGIANIYVQAEQAPNPDSRITLSDEADILGVPMLNQDCRVLPIDKRTLVMLGELFGRELGLLNAGRVQLAEWLLDDSVTWDRQMWGGCHHLGTTRMSESATDGVVDANCKLHNIDNTYVASSSVFTTGGYANPTISIVALALRLAEHIQSKES